MADSEDEFTCAGHGFYESLTQESMVETPQKKRDYAKLVEEDVSIKPTSSKKRNAEQIGGNPWQSRKIGLKKK